MKGSFPMFNVYDLMKSGLSAEEIAAEFTQNLNDAETRIEAERIEEVRRQEEAKREEARRKEEAARAVHSAKREDFAAIARLFFETIGKHYPNLDVEEIELSDEEYLALADMIILAIDLEVMRMSLAFNPVEKDKPIKESKVDPFAAFFKQFGL
jgi:hypothetical protein